jgi:hypothetical protein
MPDAVPGKNILLPFFLCKISGGESTLLVLQNVSGTATTFKINVYDIDSNKQIDFNKTLTKNDVEPWRVREDFIEKGSPDAKKALSIDLDGDGTVDHYAGYIWCLESGTLNATVGFIYQIDLANGIASGANAVSVEYAANAVAGTVNATTNLEQFSAQAFVNAKVALGQFPAAFTASAFAMYPRYFVYNANSANWLLSWRDTKSDYTYHVDFYDEEENSISTNIPLTHELDIIDVLDYLPAGLATAYPYAGWIDWVAKNESANGYGILGGTSSNANGFRNTAQWIMYNYQKAVSSSASSNWNVLFDVHRDAGSAGASPFGK